MTIEEIVQDINGKLDALQQDRVSEERVRELVKELLDELGDDQEFVRKLRFGGGSDPVLAGSKYARFGMSVADVEFLYALMEGARGIKQPSGRIHPGPSEELTRTFRAIQEVSGVRFITQEQARKEGADAIESLFQGAPASQFFGKDRELAERGQWYQTEAFQKAMRAMDTAEAGYGAQLIGAQYVRELWEGARAKSRIFSLIESFPMTDPTAYLPVEADIPEMLFVTESTTSSATNYATSKSGSRRVQVDAKKFVIHQMWSGELEEDSIIPFVPFIRRQAEKSIQHYSDSLVLNGDTTNAGTGNINLDDADPADTKHYLAFDGIRHAGLVDNTGNSKDAAGPVTLGLLSGQRGRMLDSTYLMDWGHPDDPGDLVYVADPETGDRISLMDEVITVDKFGPQATVLTGQQARVLGHPLINSIAMSKTEADGKVSTTGANNTKGQVAAFNRRGAVVGTRRAVKVEAERIPATDQTRLVHSLRLGFGRFSPTGAAAGIEWADVLYNLTL